MGSFRGTSYRWNGPAARRVREHGVVRFRVWHRDGSMGRSGDRVIWYVFEPGEEDTRPTVGETSGQGPDEFYLEVEFERPGRWEVAAKLELRDGEPQVHRWDVRVQSTRQALIEGMRRSLRQGGFPNPLDALATIRRYVDTVEEAAEWARENGRPTTNTPMERKDLRRLSRHADALEGVLRRRFRAENFLCSAEYAPRGDPGQTRQLRLFLVRSDEQPTSGAGWTLVDWTDPTEHTARGHYQGTGATDAEAINDAVDSWFANNRYPEGRLYIRGEPGTPGGLDRGGDTDGQTSLGSLSGWLDLVATGLAVFAGVVTLVAPIPGSRVVSAAIWGGIVLSSTAAGIRIYERQTGNFGTARDDAIDSLTIVANLFTAGTVSRWRAAGALRTAAQETNVNTYFLVGQVSADVTQGALLATEYLEELNEILDDPDATPKDRTDRLLSFFGRLATDGACLAVSLRGAQADLDHAARDRLRSLESGGGDPLDAVPHAPRVEAEVAGGGVETTVRRTPEPPPIETPPRRQRERRDRRRGPPVEDGRTADGSPAPDLYYDCGRELQASQRELGYEHMSRNQGRRRIQDDYRELVREGAEFDAPPFENSSGGVGTYGEMSTYRFLREEGVPAEALVVSEPRVAEFLNVELGPRNNRVPMVDLLQMRGSSEVLIPTEVKNRFQVDLDEITPKFESIMDNAPEEITRRIPHFEVVAHVDTRLPGRDGMGGYAVNEAGELWRATGGENVWEPVLVRGKPVIFRRAELGPMWHQDSRRRVRRGQDPRRGGDS